MILQVIFTAFLLFFPFIWPSSKIGTTNQMQKPKISDIIIFLQAVHGQVVFLHLTIEPISR